MCNILVHSIKKTPLALQIWTQISFIAFQIHSLAIIQGWNDHPIILHKSTST
jgi:hypothetical protein